MTTSPPAEASPEVSVRPDGPTSAARSLVPVPPPPAAAPRPVPRIPAARRALRFAVLAALLLGAGGGGYAWWRAHQPWLPAGFAQGNGRLEADEIDISTKFAGRLAQVLADEGDLVRAGQVVAVMDTRDLQAQMGQAEAMAGQAAQAVEEADRTLAQQETAIRSSEATVARAQRALDEANANLQQEQSRLRLAKQELARTSTLVGKGFATHETLDTRQQVVDVALAAEAAARARIGAAEHALAAAREAAAGAVAARDAAAARVGATRHALDAARHSVDFYRVNIADNSLTAPRDGPIQYRIANVGEVLAAGGKVLTMLDAGYVYMDLYLPTAEAGRVTLGAEGRIVLDAYPDHVIPAKVVFVASRAQFTPKTVETRDERDKLMFRIRLRVDPERLKGREALVRAGLPGIGYVRTDAAAAWPARLAPSAPPSLPLASAR
ncbi:HlyD family secretion protein [Methylobacterium sp. WSM2598]|uniref:HlyD family secretion protein n=1 Tax=Methylobacterium sp. WSM2598 TaxID=398261 RepID=UPI0003A6C4EF|nr:HlyD family efflux transporter periplasmic adaptor subunit [Methylobacterium sp. WSM2598]